MIEFYENVRQIISISIFDIIINDFFIVVCHRKYSRFVSVSNKGESSGPASASVYDIELQQRDGPHSQMPGDNSLAKDPTLDQLESDSFASVTSVGRPLKNQSFKLPVSSKPSAPSFNPNDIYGKPIPKSQRPSGIASKPTVSSATLPKPLKSPPYPTDSIAPEKPKRQYQGIVSKKRKMFETGTGPPPGDWRSGNASQPAVSSVNSPKPLNSPPYPTDSIAPEKPKRQYQGTVDKKRKIFETGTGPPPGDWRNTTKWQDNQDIYARATK